MNVTPTLQRVTDGTRSRRHYRGVWKRVGELAAAALPLSFLTTPGLAQEKVRVTPVETMRLVGETPAGLIGRIVCVSEVENNVFLLDGQLSTVQVLDTHGEKARVLLRPGEGPAELEFASWMTPINNEIAVCSYSPKRLKVLSHLEQEIERLNLFPDLRLRTLAFMSEPGVLVAQQASTRWAGEDFQQQFRFVGIQFDGVQDSDTLGMSFPFGKELEPINSTRDSQGTWRWAEADARAMTDLPPRWAVSRDQLFVAPSFGDYKVDAYGPDGKLLKTVFIDEPYESVAKRDEEQGWFADQYDNAIIEPAAYHPDIVGLFTRPDGSLWVLPSNGCNAADRDQLEFIVYSPDGVKQHRVVLDLELDLDRELPLSTYRDGIFISDDALFIVTELSSKYASDLEPIPPMPTLIRLEFPSTSPSAAVAVAD